MATYDFLPSSTYRNDGPWAVVGAADVAAAIGDSNDATYIKGPSNLGSAHVRFPFDTTVIPAGAVISSVTAIVRAARIGATPRQGVIGILPADAPPRVRWRRFMPAETIGDFNVLTYVSDATGAPWDINRLNNMVLVLGNSSQVTDAIRVYKAWVRLLFHYAPVTAITYPTGIVTTPSPLIQWTYTQSEGDQLAKTEYKIFTSDQSAQVGFNPDNVTPVFSRVVDSSALEDPIPFTLPSEDYTIYIRTTSSHGAKSPWASRTFQIMAPAPAIPGNDNAGVTGVPGVGTVTCVGDSYNGSVTMTMRDASNLLGVQAADFETLTDAMPYVGTNCTIARNSTTVYTPGTGSMSLTTTSAGTASALGDWIEVEPGQPFTLRAQVRAGTTARTATLSVQFYDIAFSTQGAAVSANTTDSNSTWKEIVATGTVPALGRYARVTVSFASTAVSEIHYTDRVGLMYGTNSAWSHGGHLSRNILDTWYSNAEGTAVGSAGWIANNAATTRQLVATTGTGSSGVQTNQMTYVGLTPTIGYRGTSTEFSDTASGTGFTLNKPVTPAATVDGDLMIAFVTTTVPSAITPPDGWEVVNSTSSVGVSGLYILKRTFLTGDPTTWAGSFASAASRRTANVVSYSGAAPAAAQFLVDSVRNDPSSNYIHTTTTVNNTDANAWRVGCISAADNVAGGSFTVNKMPPTTPPPSVQYVGQGYVEVRDVPTISNQAYTLTKPVGVIEGDLMIGVVWHDGLVTAIAPAGWTVVRSQQVSQTQVGTLTILKRTTGPSDPSTWTGTHTQPNLGSLAKIIAYRNAKDASLQFLDDDVIAELTGPNITVPAVTNTKSNVMAVSAFGARVTPNVPHNWTCLSATERADHYYLLQNAIGDAMAMAIYDSNTTISTGNYNITAKWDPGIYIGAGWSGLIEGIDVAPAPGANETERRDSTIGASDPWLSQVIVDSNGVIPAGDTNLTGTFVGATPTSMMSWIGIIKPFAPTISGTASVTTFNIFDISKIDPLVLTMADRKMTFIASFHGSVGGTPHLTLKFYRSNQFLADATSTGTTFDSTFWTKSYCTFDVPVGTTRVVPVISVDGMSVSQTVRFDRMSIAFGESTVWREGTGRAEHPVWSHPEIQYQDDDGTGYGEWLSLKGFWSNPPEFEPYNGSVVYLDHTLIPLSNRKYRVQTVSYGLAGDTYVSGYGPESEEISLIAQHWWLKDPQNPEDNMILRVYATPTQVSKSSTSVTVQPLGKDLPMVVSDGYKGDSFEVTVITDHDEHVALKNLITTRRTLFLQGDVDEAWWVRCVSNLDSEIQVTGQRKTNPIRFEKLAFVQVDPEA